MDPPKSCNSDPQALLDPRTYGVRAARHYPTDVEIVEIIDSIFMSVLRDGVVRLKSLRTQELRLLTPSCGIAKGYKFQENPRETYLKDLSYAMWHIRLGARWHRDAIRADAQELPMEDSNITNRTLEAQW
ncbi:hypothetical protein TWF191_008226 [Orbilia oligospora]|uniref:Uncharacterized protein n=1 Tax=Orbilia oligospora TaxID=2813651 RepID=A0A7C8USH7_ORBOL|nr:hypothetical protein TWF191_008226 [Orbilia oligospora]